MLRAHYYQIGGFQGHLKGPPDALAQQLFSSRDSSNGIGLILGIRPSGASYILMSEPDYKSIVRPRWRDDSWPAERFISLSPIHFTNAKELSKKIYTMISKKPKKGGEPSDRSKANTTYTAGGDGLSEVGKLRAAFEHQRVLFRLCHQELAEPSDFALQPDRRLRDARIIALTYTSWEVDVRALRDRRKEPTILDFGWTEFSLPTASQELTPKTSTHLRVKEHSFYQNPTVKRVLFKHGTTEDVVKASLDARLQELFPAQADPATPILLFVHNAQKTVETLEAHGVDTSQWAVGIFDLLYSGDADISQRNSDRDSRAPRSSRSRSPRRFTDDRGRPRSPSPTPRRAAVYVVDVREMYLKMKNIVGRKDTIIDHALDLGIELPMCTAEANHEQDIPWKRSWCAGNESRLLGEMWTDMARGPAIDEQRALRSLSSVLNPTAPQDSGPSTAASGAPQTEVEDDDDFDPNDIIVPMGQGGNSAPMGQTGLEERDSGTDSDSGY